MMKRKFKLLLAVTIMVCGVHFLKADPTGDHDDDESCGTWGTSHTCFENTTYNCYTCDCTLWGGFIAWSGGC